MDLAQYKSELRHIQAQRQELEHYIMTLCHELRTPLNGTLGYIQQLSSKWDTQPKATEKADMLDDMVREVARTGNPDPLLNMINDTYRREKAPTYDSCKPILEKAQACAELQLAIVEDLLDYTRSQSGKGATPEHTHFNIHDAMEQAMDTVKAAHPKSQNFTTHVICHLEQKNMEMVGDRRRIVQLLINLLSNAFKATTAGSVKLFAHNNSNDLPNAVKSFCIDVIDTGTGMSKGAIDKNYATPFAASTTTTGLGFGIVRHVVEEILGGKLSVASEVDKGTTVKVELPLNINNSSHGGNMWKNTSMTTYVPEYQFPVLVVDDQEVNSETLVALLEHIGHTDNVEVAADGDTALTMIEKRHSKNMEPYAVVFMDVQMPRLNGDDATKKLREIETEQNRIKTHVIGLSAYANDSTRENCISKGMDAYCTKPMQISKLRDVLASLPLRTGWEPDLRKSQSPNKAHLRVSPLSQMMQAIATAKKRGTFEERINTCVRVSFPYDFAQTNQNIIDLKEAWEEGVPNRDIIIKGMQHVYAMNTESMHEHIKKKDWNKLKNEAHRLAGTCTFIRANPLVHALRSLEEQARRMLNGKTVFDNDVSISRIASVDIELSKTKAEVARFVEERAE
jgi:signal transduction histidine kinase/DNA-binding response OmpR family regulator